MVALVVILGAACGGSGGDSTPSAAAVSAAVRGGGSVDYSPLDSPAAAIERADAVIIGTITDVTEGIAVEGRSRSPFGFATFHVDVERWIAGSHEAQTVYMQVQTGPAERGVPADLSRAVGLRGAFVLGDITTWRPGDDTTVRRPSAIPPDSLLYFPHMDGAWLEHETSGDLVGLHVPPSELAPGWGAPVRFVDLTDRLVAAGDAAT